MAVRKAGAVWNGSLREGAGTVRFGSGEHAYEGAYSFPSRFEEGDGTNPEELIAAAHAGCFSMALSSELGKVGFEPISIETEATLTLEPVDGAQTISRRIVSPRFPGSPPTPSWSRRKRPRRTVRFREPWQAFPSS